MASLAGLTPEQRREHMRELGSRGGRATVDRYGRAHMSEIGARGFAAALSSIGGHALYQLIGDQFRAKFGCEMRTDTSRPEYRAGQAVRAQARRMYPEISCDQCGSAPAERHHVNGTAAGNAPENIAGKCRPHHRQLHHAEWAARRQQLRAQS